MAHPKDDDRRDEKDFYKKPGGGLIDPQGAPKDDEVTEPTEELLVPLGEEKPRSGFGQKPRQRGG